MIRPVPIRRRRWRFPFDSTVPVRGEEGYPMDDTDQFARMPGLYRLWDIQFILCGGDEYRIHFAELTEDGTPLFAVYRKPVLACGKGVEQ